MSCVEGFKSVLVYPRVEAKLDLTASTDLTCGSCCKVDIHFGLRHCGPPSLGFFKHQNSSGGGGGGHAAVSVIKREGECLSPL